ncbi:hypothetical protein [Bacillus wiedmannii]|uniref:hypothetical protein n=1 Tax=Bacillus wiedmannii TaxID=1890302 RepID=UPI0024071503|nr:hypothetical protein [Bacillus wiedmannii]MDF9663788.1 hypothetical protein [Bacillus wiedmannii]
MKNSEKYSQAKKRFGKSKLSTEKRDFLKIQHNIRTEKSINSGISKFKTFGSIEHIMKYTNKLSEHPMYRRFIYGNALPKDIKELGRGEVLCAVEEIERELIWTSQVLPLFSDVINTFLEMQKEYTSNLLKGDYEKAAQILDEIRKNTGFSMWYLENKISLLELTKGLEYQKEYTNKIVKDESISPIVRWLVTYFSIRAEKNISVNKYKMIMQEMAQEVQNIPLLTYVEYKLNFFGKQHKISHLNYISFFESKMSIIDRYLTFIKLCQLLSVKPKDISLEILKTAVLIVYQGKINDYKLENLLSSLGEVNSIPVSVESNIISAALNNYTMGNYQKCYEICSNFLSTNPQAIEIYEIYVKSAINLEICVHAEEDSSIMQKLLTGLYNIILRNEWSNESYLEILKYIEVYSSQFWAVGLYGVILNHYIYKITEEEQEYISVGRLYMHPHNPLIVECITDSGARESYFQYLKECFPKSITLKLVKTIKENDCDELLKLPIPKYRIQKYQSQIMIHKGMHREAIRVFMELIRENRVLSWQDAIVGLTECYLQTEQLKECIELIVSAYFKNENLYDKFPLRKLLNKVEQVRSRQLVSNISLPILYDIYSRHFSKDKDYLKSDAYEDFLSEYNLDFPSQLERHISELDGNKLIYFLKYICVFNVMDNSVVFENSEEVEKERIKVCQLLRQLDPDNEQKYSDEIKSITQKLMITKGMREIEKSKIYVDVIGIKKSLEKNLKESYTRYLAFQSNIIQNETPEYITIGSTEGEGLELKMPVNEKQGLFTAMVLELRDNFVSSNEYGLDSYLSVGIRHGTVSGQLRSPLEANNLITQKDTKTNLYHSNTHWINKYNSSDKHSLEAIDMHLKQFSRQIDDLIELLKNKWIQIKTEQKNSEGLFNFQIILKELEALQSNITVHTPYEEFVDKVIEMLWRMTEDSLFDIRGKISNDLKRRFYSAFDGLEQNLNSLKERVDLTEIISHIRTCRTSIEYELDKIAGWFTRTNITERSDYDIRLPIDIGLEIIKYTYPNHDLKTNIKPMDTCTLKGKTLKSMVDICVILFDNIIKHTDNDEKKVSIEFQKINNHIRLYVENEVNEGLNIDEKNEHLLKIKKSIVREKVMDKVRTEGGTGFYKIKKIISIDLGCDHTIDFEYTQDNKFKVAIEFDAKELIL